MHELTALIKNDMTPALGVTEPGAIAFCVAKARGYVGGQLKKITVAMNSGMYKNAFTCGIPGAEQTGILHAAALGYVAGKPEKGLMVLEDVQTEDNEKAARLVADGMVGVRLSGMTSRIYICARVETDKGAAEVTVQDTHTGITCIKVNGSVVFGAEEENAKEAEEQQAHPICRYTVADILTYINTVDPEEIAFVDEAYRVNMELFHEGLAHPRTTFARALLAMNGGQVFSGDELGTASLLAGGAIEARVIGLNKPAMSITGSGAHGIIATLPLHAVCRLRGLDEQKLRRATMLSYLICTYIKEYSGRLSAFCGCGIAAGSGMACGLCYLYGGGLEEVERTLQNMAASITGMICDGGNQGCAMKGIAACDAAFRAARLAMAGAYVDAAHGICGSSGEETMRYMGRIASPGMVGTEKTIVEIFEEKLK
ncbi:MAG: serine dehydratase subunit alpha family protein [Christensenellaceae bacterium]|nr:serine dehydratase subunit alpha family protein [Christensenellaceae bacterium]